jgi:uncharacterized protein
MTMHFLAEGLVVRELLGKGGKGVFATRPIERGTLLASYGGAILTGAELKKLSTAARWYALQVEDDLHLVTPLDQVAGADFINHACQPNAGLSGTTSLVALRAIRAGEEICFDYAMSDSHEHLDFACQCGKPKCRKFVRPDDWRRPELQRRYRKVFSPYLRRRIAAMTLARRRPAALVNDSNKARMSAESMP